MGFEQNITKIKLIGYKKGKADMQYEIDLIKRKATAIMNNTTDENVHALLTDIIKLTDACLDAIKDIDDDLTDMCLSMRRVTTDIK